MMDVILHCSDSAFGNAVMIDQWHAAKGFKNTEGIHIGYHLVILNGHLTAKKFNKFFDGLIETGRALDDDDIFEWDEMAAATLGKNDCVQICMIGKSGQFTSSQILSVIRALKWLRQIFHVIHVSQHSDYDPVNRPYCAGLTEAQMKLFNQP
jgi:N-acetylmuramoyl-L-alanine amidase